MKSGLLPLKMKKRDLTLFFIPCLDQSLFQLVCIVGHRIFIGGIVGIPFKSVAYPSYGIDPLEIGTEFAPQTRSQFQVDRYRKRGRLPI